MDVSATELNCGLFLKKCLSLPTVAISTGVMLMHMPSMTETTNASQIVELVQEVEADLAQLI